MRETIRIQSKRLRLLRALAAANAFFLLLNIFSFAFISRLNAPETSAQEALFCMKICEAGSLDCDYGLCALAPTVSTDSVSSVTETTAVASGTVSSDGDDAVTERGFAVSTTTSPTISDTKFSVSGTTGTFSTTITGLTQNTTYYVRAFAVNSIGTAYGDNIYFTTSATEPVDDGEDTTEETETSETTEPIGSTPLSVVASPGTTSGNIPPEDQERSIVEGESDVPFYNEIRLYSYVSEDETTAIPDETVGTYIPYSSTLLEFRGKTNIKNAIIIVNLTSPQIAYGVTSADEYGNWSWVSPFVVAPGAHKLSVVAMSPVNASIQEKDVLSFTVGPKPEEEQETSLPAEEAPEASPSPDAEESPLLPDEKETPEQPESESSEKDEDSAIPDSGTEKEEEILFPEFPEKNIDTKDVYIISPVPRVPKEGIQSTDTIDVDTKISRLEKGGPGVAEITYRITDPSGKKIFEEKKEVDVSRDVVDSVRLVMQKELPSGEYVLRVTLEKDGVTAISTTTFSVIEKRVTVAPGITLPLGKIYTALYFSLGLLSVLFFFLVILLVREYRLAKKDMQVEEKDLWMDNDII